MRKNLHFYEARELMLETVKVMPSEEVPLSQSYGRVLSDDVYALEDNPSFARSAFDGYAFIAEDTVNASKDCPVTLRIIEEVPAGCVPSKTVTSGTAVKILTGAPVPEGADAIVKYETVSFDDETVTLAYPAKRGNIVPAGEDVKKGSLLAAKGSIIDSAAAGTFAGQGIGTVKVYKKPRAAIISTGSELVEADDALTPGKIRNSNRYVMECALMLAGAEPVDFGLASDDTREIAELMTKALDTCDIVFVTGGVAGGDYDLTPSAMELAGAEALVIKLNIKPGGSCAYGARDGKALFCLSGNPAAAMTNFYAAPLPCLRKLCGVREYLSREIKVTLADDLRKASPQTRLIRGKLDLSDGAALMRLTGQGGSRLHALMGCDVMAVVPPGSPELPAGTVLDAFLIG